ncbi:MAG: hypothetical protein HZA49_05295 [Planctomycetes bacterium]|nr:hypothetical protein [Planctomycetota bacterium]
MKYPFLLVIFIIHALAFGNLYRKNRKYYYLILTFGFLFLIGYYLPMTLKAEMTTLLIIVRWTGITVATVGGVLLLKAQLKSLKLWLMMNPKTMMLFLRIILAYVKFKDKMNRVFNNKEGDKSTMSKTPLYIMVIFLCLVAVFASNSFISSRVPDMLTKGDLRIVYKHAKEEDAGYPYRFNLTVSSRSVKVPADGVKVYWMKGEDYRAKKDNLQKSDFNVTTMETTGDGLFTALLPTREKNTRYAMFMEINDAQNNLIATMPPLPDDPPRLGSNGTGNELEKHQFYGISYKTDPNKYGLLVHIVLMLVALMLLIHAFYYAFNYLWNRQDWIIGKSASSLFWGILCYGISAFPLGIWIEYEKYGTYWTGFPLGWDITDSKTLFNFVYWAMVVILLKGTIFSKDKAKDLISYKTYAWVAILGGILTIVVRFAIPHGDL